MLNSFESVRISAAVSVRVSLVLQLEKLKAIVPKTPEILELIEVTEEMLAMQEAFLRQIRLLSDIGKMSIADQLLIKPKPAPAQKKPGL